MSYKRSQETSLLCSIFPTRVSEKDGITRTNLLSFKSLCGPLAFFAVYFGLIVAIEPLYH